MDVIFKENNIFYNVLCFLITENEKLFDRSDAKLYWRTVTHVLMIYHNAFLGLFAKNLSELLENNEDRDLRIMFTFRAAYVTGWNVLFQTVFLFLALSHDCLEWASKTDSAIAKKVRYWRDVLFSGLVVPYTCFVFTMFWSVYSIDRELVFPKVYDVVIPWWFNQCVHTNIMVLLVVETLLQPRRHPTDKKLELILDASVGILYAVVYYTIFFLTGRWLYNVFGVMTWWQVCLFQIVIWTSSYVFYLLQFPINRMVHGKEPENQLENKPDQNGEVKEIIETNEELKKNGEFKNGDLAQNGTSKVTDLNIPPFSTKSWSIKYRSIRNQFENTSL